MSDFRHIPIQAAAILVAVLGLALAAPAVRADSQRPADESLSWLIAANQKPVAAVGRSRITGRRGERKPAAPRPLTRAANQRQLDSISPAAWLSQFGSVEIAAP